MKHRKAWKISKYYTFKEASFYISQIILFWLTSSAGNGVMKWVILCTEVVSENVLEDS